jgi:hypothetical protein
VVFHAPIDEAHRLRREMACFDLMDERREAGGNHRDRLCETVSEGPDDKEMDDAAVRRDPGVQRVPDHAHKFRIRPDEAIQRVSEEGWDGEQGE